MTAFDQDPNIAQIEINDPQSFSDASYNEALSQAAASDILNMIQTTPKLNEQSKLSIKGKRLDLQQQTDVEDYESVVEGEKIKQKARLG